MVIEEEDWKMQSLYQHSQRCYIFGIFVKDGEIGEIDQLIDQQRGRKKIVNKREK